MTYEEAIQQAEADLSQALYISECSENKGIVKIYSNKADLLSNLLYLAKIGLKKWNDENTPERQEQAIRKYKNCLKEMEFE